MKKILFIYMALLCTTYIFGAEENAVHKHTGSAVPPTALRPIVSGIQAMAVNGTIVLTWQQNPEALNGIKELTVFRAFERIKTVDKTLSDKNTVQLAALDPASTSYTDTEAETEKTYYYAVIARESDGFLYDLIIPSVNATASGCTLPAVVKVQREKEQKNKSAHTDEAKPYTQAPSEPPFVLREKPLPVLYIFPEDASLKSGAKAQTEKTQPAAEQSGTPDASEKTEILPQDMSGTDITGDDYTLFVLVDSFIRHNNWEAAEKEFTQFLQINRSDETTARASFYLGQSLYRLGKYREALYCFQQAQRLYPVVSKRWSTRVLDAYRID